jgi:PIN domain nuclease of toxin-antitoxin system
MSNKIVLDTHILIWSILSPDYLSLKIREKIAAAQELGELYIASITLWEIAMLINKRRINVFERTYDFLNSIANIEGLNIIEIDADIAAESVMLPGGFTSDPADCLIIATTRKIAGQLITRDQRIITWANQGYLKVIMGK